MIENKNEVSKDLEKALQALEQAKQRVANEKKKQSEKKRKAENHHKYIMGGFIVKYFPDCYCFDEGELNHILQAALQTKECQQMISKIKTESRGNVFTPFTGCAQIYHQRWYIYVRPPGGKFHLHGLLRRAVRQRQAHIGGKASKLASQSPIGAKEPPLPPSEALLRFVNICVQIKAKEHPLSAYKVYPCASLRYRQNVGVAYV